jgi:hypothetical protein
MTPAEASLMFRNISYTTKRSPSNERRVSIEESLFSDEDDDGAELELNDEMRLELQELHKSVHGPPLPTTICLQQFKNVAVRQLEPEVKGQKEADLFQAKAEREIHVATLDQLRKWAEWKTDERNVIGKLKQAFRSCPTLPPRDDIIKMAKHHYPMRAEAVLNVCDFGKTTFTRTQVRFADIDDCMSCFSSQ